MHITRAPLSKLFLLGLIGLGLSCKTGGTPVSDTGPGPVPIVSGAVDCAGPSLWKTVTFATVVPIAEHAVAQKDPYGAINDLIGTYLEAEVACVIAYLHDNSSKQAIASPSNTVVATRLDVTAEWLRREANKGLVPTNFAGQAH